MDFENGETGVYKSDYWRVLSESVFTNLEYELDDESEFGPNVTMSMQLDIDQAQVMNVVARKWEYLEAAAGEEVEFSTVAKSVAEDIAKAHDIIFNCVKNATPEEGVYVKINDTQWKIQNTENLYQQYADLLWDITGTEVWSIPGLHSVFLQRVTESSAHELPPHGVVDDILREHIESVRAETQSRAGVQVAKRELEKHGVNARQAASVAKSLEPYLKTDADLE